MINLWNKLLSTYFCCLQQLEWFLGISGGWSSDEQGKKAEERLSTDPYDTEAWNMLVREAQVCLFLRTLQSIDVGIVLRISSINNLFCQRSCLCILCLLFCLLLCLHFCLFLCLFSFVVFCNMLSLNFIDLIKSNIYMYILSDCLNLCFGDSRAIVCAEWTSIVHPHVEISPSL